MLGLAEQLGQLEAQGVGRLVGRVVHQLARGRLVGGQAAVGLHRDVGVAVLAEGLAHHPVGGGEGAVDVAVLPTVLVGDVVAELLVEQTGPRCGGPPRRRAPAPAARSSISTRSPPSSARSRLSATTRAIGSPTQRTFSRGQREELRGSQAGGPLLLHRVDPAAASWSPVMTATTPGRARAVADVDGHDPGVGMKAAEEGDVEHPGDGDVVDEAPLAGEQPGILDPPDTRPDEAVDHQC